MYDVHRLRLLLELHRRGTLSAVAEALSYSPSTISQQLSQLESEVGVPLLEPVGRRVRLTPQADILVTHAELVLEQLEAAEAAVARSLEELTGTVRFATFQTGLLRLLSPVLTALASRHPRLRVEVFQVEPEIALPRMLAHDYDLVIVEEYPRQSLPQRAEIDYQELSPDPMRLCVPATALADGSAQGWDLVSRLPWAAESVGAASRQWIQELCREAGFEPDIRYTTDDLLVQQQLVADGHAVAILPELLVGSPGRSDVVDIDVPGGPYTRRILTACRQVSAKHPAIEACRAALAEVASDPTS